MSRAENKQKIMGFLESIRRPDVGLEGLAENDSLIESGLIDSLALLEIITFLETEFGIDFSATGVDPNELASVADILDLIERRSA